MNKYLIFCLLFAGCNTDLEDRVFDLEQKEQSRIELSDVFLGARFIEYYYYSTGTVYKKSKVKVIDGSFNKREMCLLELTTTESLRPTLEILFCGFRQEIFKHLVDNYGRKL